MMGFKLVDASNVGVLFQLVFCSVGVSLPAHYDKGLFEVSITAGCKSHWWLRLAIIATVPRIFVASRGRIVKAMYHPKTLH